MAARFWVTGGTGNWNDTSNWSATSGGASGASVPGSADTATFNASSGSGTVTLDISPVIQTLTCTGFTGTLAFGTNTISLNSTGTIFTGATTMTVTGTPLIICTNSSATARTITPGAVTEANSISFRITAGTGSISLTSNQAVRDLDFTDGVNPTGYAGAFGNFSNIIYGSFKASTGMTRIGGTSPITFAATSGTKTINTAGVTFDCPFIFNGVGGTFQLQAALTSGATRNCTLTNGTLDLASYTLTTGGFSSSNSNTRSIAFGTGSIVITNNSGTVWSCATLTNFSYTGNSNVNLTYSGSVGTRSLSHGNSATGTEARAINFNISAGTDTVTLNSTFFANNLNFTGFAGTLTANSRNIYGNLILSSGMALNSGVTSVTTFAATSGTKTITSNGKTMDFLVTFDGVNGTWSLQDALTLGSTQTLTLTNGTLTTNGYAVTTGLFASNNANVRALNLGASTVTVTSAGTAWDITTSTNMTLNAGSSSLVFTGTSTTITMQGGSLTYYDVTFNPTYFNVTVNGANTFNNFTQSPPPGVGRRLLTFNANTTINGTLSTSGSAANARTRLNGPASGVTLTVASVAALSDVDFSDIDAAGASAPWSGTRLGDGGGCNNITFTTSKTVYWNKPAGGNWSDVAWATSSGGAVNINNFPLGQDTAILDNTGVGASSTIVIDYSYLLPSLSAGSLTNALTLNWNTPVGSAIFYGDVTLSSSMTLTRTNGSTGFFPLNNGSITTAGVIFPLSFTFGAIGNIITLNDSLTSTFGSVILEGGTVDLNGNTLSCVVFDSSNSNFRTIAFNGGNVTVTGNSATVWSCENLTNFGYTGTPTVNFTYSGSIGTRTIQNGSTSGTETNSVNMNITAGFDSVVLSTTGAVLNLNYTGFSGSGNFPGFIYGNLILSATQTNPASGNTVTFAATSGTKTITTNGVTIDRSIIFNGVGGTWSLQDALTIGATRSIQLYAGTFTTNNYPVSCGKFGGSTATGDRTLNLGSSSIICTGGLPATTASWQVEDGGFLYTINAGTSTIFMSEPFTGASPQNFLGGGKTYNNVVYTTTQPGGFYGNNAFNSISNTAQPLTLSFEAGTTQTVNNFAVSGTSGNLVTLNSVTPGTQWGIAKNTGGKVLVSFCSITDSAATPAGYWFAPTSQGNVDGGNNTGWNFDSAGGVTSGFFPFF